MELADLGLVDGRLSEVKAIEVTRQREAGQAQLIVERARLALSDLSSQQLSQPARRGEPLLAERRQALLQGVGHATQAQHFHSISWACIVSLRVQDSEDGTWPQQLVIAIAVGRGLNGELQSIGHLQRRGSRG